MEDIFESLTSREKEVLELVVKGYNNVQIGKELFISRHTAKRLYINKFCIFFIIQSA